MGITAALGFGVCTAASLFAAFSHLSEDARRRCLITVISVSQVFLMAPSALNIFVNSTNLAIHILKLHICTPDMISSTLCLCCAGAMSVTVCEISHVRGYKTLMELSNYTTALNILLLIESVTTIIFAVC